MVRRRQGYPQWPAAFFGFSRLKGFWIARGFRFPYVETPTAAEILLYCLNPLKDNYKHIQNTFINKDNWNTHKKI